jgi:hypothetical protein
VNDTHLFDFESDFVATLRCVPMAVRFKLDRCGIKLTLRQWSRFTPQDRRGLLQTPCHTAEEVTAYHSDLVELVRRRADSEVTLLPGPVDALWEQTGDTPAAVQAFARTVRVGAPSAAEWSRLSQLQRFTLLKLSRDNHDNVNFIPALREFGLAEDAAT